nr:40S ribosomal protein S11 [Tanacetum cinerariifolium]
MSSPGALSAGPSTPPNYSSGPSTPLSYSSGLSTPPNYSSRSSRNAECSNCKHLRGKISVLKATMNMHMHPEQHTVNSAALLHEEKRPWKGGNKLWKGIDLGFKTPRDAIELAGDGITSIKRRRHDQSSDDVRIMVTASIRDRLKEDLESSKWRRRQDCKATPSRVEASNAMRGLNIPNPLPELADCLMISTSADESDDQKSVGHSITSILQFRLVNLGQHGLVFHERRKTRCGFVLSYIETGIKQDQKFNYIRESRGCLEVGWKDEYKTWAMKMEYWIMNTDHNLWKVIQNGIIKKSLGRDSKGGIIILPPVSFEEQVDVQRETKAKTLGGREYLSFDDLYNKLRSLEIDVKGGSSYGFRSTAVAPTHYDFIGAASTNTKMVYSDQPSYSSSISYTPVPAGSIIEDVLYFFVAENKPTQQLAYEDFEQAGRKINFNNKDSARFDRRKARCYNCLQLEHFARECNVKKNEHEAEHKPEEGEQVYGLMVGFKSDFTDPAVTAAGSVYDVAVEFTMMGISPNVQTCPFDCDSKLSELKKNYAHLETMYNDFFIQVQAYKNTVKTLELQKDWYHKTQLALEENVRILSANLENTTNTLKYSETLYDQAKIEKKEWEVKFIESLARFDKWKASSKNLAKLINSSMTTRTKLGLRFKEYFGSDEELLCRPLPTVFLKKLREVKSLYERFVKAGDTHEVPPSITGTFMPTSSNSVLEETQDCHVYDTVDNFLLVVLKAASVPAGSRNSSASTSAGGSIPAASRNRSASIHAGRSIPAASRNRSTSIHAGRSIPATSKNRPASIPAGRHIPAGRSNQPTPFPAGRTVLIGWINHAARPFFGPTNLCFDNVYCPGIYNHMSMNEGRWGSAVKS